MGQPFGWRGRQILFRGGAGPAGPPLAPELTSRQQAGFAAVARCSSGKCICLRSPCTGSTQGSNGVLGKDGQEVDVTTAPVLDVGGVGDCRKLYANLRTAPGHNGLLSLA